MFAIAFNLLESASPGSFVDGCELPTGPSSGKGCSTTATSSLSTLGYGEILPLSATHDPSVAPPARQLPLTMRQESSPAISGRGIERRPLATVDRTYQEPTGTLNPFRDRVRARVSIPYRASPNHGVRVPPNTVVRALELMRRSAGTRAITRSRT